MKNKVNFLWKGFRLCAFIALVSLIAFSMVSCDDKDKVDNTKATLIVMNESLTATENIRKVTIAATNGKWHQEYPTQITPNNVGTFTLEPEEYTITVETNAPNQDQITRTLNAGITYKLSWIAGRLEWS